LVRGIVGDPTIGAGVHCRFHAVGGWRLAFGVGENRKLAVVTKGCDDDVVWIPHARGGARSAKVAPTSAILSYEHKPVDYQVRIAYSLE
jgi:hypothetical protein